MTAYLQTNPLNIRHYNQYRPQGPRKTAIVTNH